VTVSSNSRCTVLKRALGFGRPAVCLIRSPEEGSWTSFRRRSLIDPAFRSYVECHRSLRSAAGDLFVVPLEAKLHKMSAVVEAIFLRYGLGDRGCRRSPETPQR
jgi:hypothetical protein